VSKFSPPAELESSFDYALWAAVRQTKDKEVVALARTWLADPRWSSVEESYQEALAALKNIGQIGPLHQAQAMAFRKQAPKLYLYLAYFTTQGGADPFEQVRLLFISAARMSGYGRSNFTIESLMNIAQGMVSEKDAKHLQALALEGAGRTQREHDAQIPALKKELKDNLATIWATHGLTQAAPRLCYTKRSTVFRLGKQSYVLFSAQADLDKKKQVYVRASLPQLLMGGLAAKHAPLPPELAPWDSCLSTSSLPAQHIVTHEVVHVLTAQKKLVAWTGHGWQKKLTKAMRWLRKAYDFKFKLFWQVGLSQQVWPRRVGNLPSRAIALPLNIMNEAFTEAATLELLGLPDPEHAAITYENPIYPYAAGIKLVRLLLADRDLSPLELLLDPTPTELLEDLFKEKTTPEGYQKISDLLFEKSGPFMVYWAPFLAEYLSAMPFNAPGDLHSLFFLSVIAFLEEEQIKLKEVGHIDAYSNDPLIP
jgi:hypothetical protein